MQNKPIKKKNKTKLITLAFKAVGFDQYHEPAGKVSQATFARMIGIQNDQPSKIVGAIKIGKITRNIVWQDITVAMIIKLIVLILGAGGVATLWKAVIADVGVALLAILNAIRIQRMKL